MSQCIILLFFLPGTEFVNRQVRTYLQQQNIKIIHPSSEKKAAIVERFNKTFQGLIYRYLTHNQTTTYVDKLARLLQTYNLRQHRTIKMTPEDAELPERQALVLGAHNAHYTKIAGKRKNPSTQWVNACLLKASLATDSTAVISRASSLNNLKLQRSTRACRFLCTSSKV